MSQNLSDEELIARCNTIIKVEAAQKYPSLDDDELSDLTELITRFKALSQQSKIDVDEKPKARERHYCRMCDQSFIDEYDLEAHVKFHH